MSNLPPRPGNSGANPGLPKEHAHSQVPPDCPGRRAKDGWPYVERRAMRRRLEPLVDIAKIGVMVAMAHLILRLAGGVGTVIAHMEKQLDQGTEIVAMMRDIQSHIHSLLPPPEQEKK